jgi:hypothetical protein
MIVTRDYDRRAALEKIEQHPKEIVIGVDNLVFPHVNENNINEFVGGIYQVEFPMNESYWKSGTEVFRVEGFNVATLADMGSWTTETYLNKNGRFCETYQIIDRDSTGNAVYAYEREKIFPTVEAAMKVAQAGKHWIRMVVVHMLQITHS